MSQQCSSGLLQKGVINMDYLLVILMLLLAIYLLKRADR